MIPLNFVKKDFIMRIGIVIMLAVLTFSFMEDARLDRELAADTPVKAMQVAKGE